MKYIIWIKEDSLWEEQGDGPLTLKQAERISNEIKRECRVRTKILPEGVAP